MRILHFDQFEVKKRSLATRPDTGAHEVPHAVFILCAAAVARRLVVSEMCVEASRLVRQVRAFLADPITLCQGE
jgi:hypothetical protein